MQPHTQHLIHALIQQHTHHKSTQVPLHQQNHLCSKYVHLNSSQTGRYFTVNHTNVDIIVVDTMFNTILTVLVSSSFHPYFVSTIYSIILMIHVNSLSITVKQLSSLLLAQKSSKLITEYVDVVFFLNQIINSKKTEKIHA